jgi:hypothetical protein
VGQQVVSPGVAAETWQNLYGSDPAALPSQSLAWARAVTAGGTYQDISRHYQFADGQQALLPLFAARFLLGRLTLHYSPPAAWGFGGLLSEHPLTPAHIHAVLADLQTLGALATQIRPNPLQAELWKEAVPSGWTAIPKLAHVLDLTGGFDEVWNRRISSKTRNRIRRAERAGLEIESGATDRLIGEFHGLLCLSIERWARRQREPAALARWRGTRRDPVAKFRAMAAAMGPSFKLWVARLDSQPIAAILVLSDRQAHYTRGAMHKELIGKTYANYLLQKNAIEEACRAGCSHYHMGETGSSASLAEFKSHFGAEAVPYAEYRYERLPISKLQNAAKSLVKRLIGFRNA